MKLSLPLAFSVGLNVALALLLAGHWRGALRTTPGNPPPNPPANAARQGVPEWTVTSQPSALTPFSWRFIESTNYPQFLANLRKVECPEYLIRDILVADLDDLFNTRAQSQPPLETPPWMGSDRRRAAERSRLSDQFAIQAEKRALIKELLGYPWDNHLNEVWHQEVKLAVLLGFLPDDEAAQVLALARQYQAEVEDLRATAQGILLPQDRTRLRDLYQRLQADLTHLVTPSEFDELQLRIQAIGFFPAHLHLEGLTVEGAELRELARISRSLRDEAETEFIGPEPVTEAERAGRARIYESELRGLLGVTRFAEYERAQDDRFRESFEFVREGHLPESTAQALFEARRAAEHLAAQVESDPSLTAQEQAAAVDELRASTTVKLAAVLGTRFRDYLDTRGSWLDTLDSSSPAAVPNTFP